MPNSEASEVADGIQHWVAGGLPVTAACNKLMGFGVDAAVVAAGRAEYERRVGIISELRDPPAVVAPGLQGPGWYGGPPARSPYWSEFTRNVKTSLPKEVAEAALVSIDDSTSRILDLAGSPGSTEIRRKGLVLGYVQSGKTTNFMGVIAKGADVGYRLFIILSGITDNLRSQTQQRVAEILVGAHGENWHQLTDLENDFAVIGNAANLLGESSQQRLIAVVKKNPARLRRLGKWLQSAGPEVMKTVPILLIDDEADQASLNTGKHRVTTINRLISEVLKWPRSSYVAYTATPFANLLTDPDTYESLYPSDFIVAMDEPTGYFGPEMLFGRQTLCPTEPEEVNYGLDVIRNIDATEAEIVRPPKGKDAVYSWSPSVPQALGESITWFILATAARRARSGECAHSTMLIHTSMLAAAHNLMRLPVEKYVSDLKVMFDMDPETRRRLKGFWESEHQLVPAESLGLEPVLWDAVEAAIPDVLDRCRVIIDNYTSRERLDYSDDDPATVIVIGGNTLSRGLTLEGLVSSYFVRTATYYDTLLQMGRWFGFRRKYEDLPRVWMTRELRDWFHDLATVEEEVRREIRAYPPHVTPRDVAVKIRTHPAMAVTSPAKMQKAVKALLDFGGRRVQTIRFKHQDAGWLNDNISAARRLVEPLVAEGWVHNRDGRSGLVARNIGVDRVREFLQQYRFHELSLTARADLLMANLEQQNEQGFLKEWNLVVFETASSSPQPSPDIGLARPLRLMGRSRLRQFDDHANIGVLTSPDDAFADSNEHVPRTDDMSEAELFRARESIVGKSGLLGLYPIDMNSMPSASEKRPSQRVPMDAVQHLIGAALFFPASQGSAPFGYVSAPIKGGAEYEVDDIDSLDREDEEIARTQDSEGTADD